MAEGVGALLQDEQARASRQRGAEGQDAVAVTSPQCVRLFTKRCSPSCRRRSNGGSRPRLPQPKRDFTVPAAATALRGAGVDREAAMYRTDLDRRDKGGAISRWRRSTRRCCSRCCTGRSDDHHRPAERGPQGFRHSGCPATSAPPPPQKQQPKPKEKEGGSAPKNIRSEATPVVAPKPKIETPPVNRRSPATETPRQGTRRRRAHRNVRGPGTGAGGTGTGTGSGSGGSGPGGGGDGGVADPPHLVTPVLTGRDFPRDLLDQWPRGATVFLRLRVNPQGSVSECTVLRGTGVATIDVAMCNLAHDRLRFRPGGQSQRASGCRMVRIRATSAAIIARKNST